MLDTLSTGQVATLLGVSPHRLDYLTRDHQIRPAKGSTGAFLWSFADVVDAAHRLGAAVPDGRGFRLAGQSTASRDDVRVAERETVR